MVVQPCPTAPSRQPDQHPAPKNCPIHASRNFIINPLDFHNKSIIIAPLISLIWVKGRIGTNGPALATDTPTLSVSCLQRVLYAFHFIAVNVLQLYPRERKGVNEHEEDLGNHSSSRTCCCFYRMHEAGGSEAGSAVRSHFHGDHDGTGISNDHDGSTRSTGKTLSFNRNETGPFDQSEGLFCAYSRDYGPVVLTCSPKVF